MAQPPFNQDPYGHNPYQAPDSNLYQQQNYDISEKLTIEEAIASGYDFDIGTVVSDGWASLKGFQSKCIFAGLIAGAIFMAVGFVLALVFGSQSTTGEGIGNIITTGLQYIFGAGFAFMALNHLRDEEVEVNQVFAGFSKAGPILLFLLVFFLIMLASMIPGGIVLFLLGLTGSKIGIVLGVITLMIPVIYLALSYQMTYWIIMDHPEASFWEAMEGSRKLITQHWFKFLGLSIVLGIINMIGALLLLIGLFWTVPMSLLVTGHVYKAMFRA